MSNSLFDKVRELRSTTSLKKKLRHKCLPVNFANFSRTAFFYRTFPVADSVFLPRIKNSHDIDLAIKTKP